MSVWRMQIDMAFATEPEMKSMMNLIQDMRDKLQKKEGDLEIPCRVTTHECMHDVGQPCGGYVTTEFDGTSDLGAPAVDAVPQKTKDVIEAPLKADKATLEAEKAALEAENAELKKPKDGATGATGA